jgi:hypothetical protein
MLVKIVFALLVFTPACLFSQDINQMPRLSLGFNVGSMNSFTNNVLNSGSSRELLLSYMMNPRMAVSVGYNTSTYTREVAKVNHSVLYPGLLLGVDYFMKSKHTFLSSSVNLSVVNAFDSFDRFENTHVDLSYRLNFYKTFYLGLGVNYTRNSITELAPGQSQNANLILQIGIRGIGFKFAGK